MEGRLIGEFLNRWPGKIAFYLDLYIQVSLAKHLLDNSIPSLQKCPVASPESVPIQAAPRRDLQLPLGADGTAQGTSGCVHWGWV